MEHTGDYRYGFQDSQGNWMIQPRYDWVQEFEESGYAVVQVGQGEDARSGLIGASGAYVLRPEYADLGSDYTGRGLRFFRREPGELWGIMADDGTVLVEPFLAADDWVSDFEAGLMAPQPLALVRNEGGGLLKEPMEEPSSWAEEELALAREAGLLPADCESFPAYPITRAQFASLAVNYLEKTTGETVEPAEADTFTDTTAETVRKAYAAGIVLGVLNGTGTGALAPKTVCTVEQAILLVFRAAK